MTNSIRFGGGCQGVGGLVGLAMAIQTRCWGQKCACVGVYGHTKVNQLWCLSVQAGMVECHVALCTYSWWCRHKSGLCALLCALLAAYGTGRNVCTSRRSLLWDETLWPVPLVTAVDGPCFPLRDVCAASRPGCKPAERLHLCCVCHQWAVWLPNLTGLCQQHALAL
jgi:hypothetical protein